MTAKGYSAAGFLARIIRAAPRWVKNLSLTLASVVFVLLGTEITLRALGISYPILYVIDADRGSALRPAAQGLWQKEGKAFIRINNDGLRDRDHEVGKSPGVIRIAVLGDSYAEAFQVDMEKTFWAIMENSLQSCKHLRARKVEVINFGVSGYGTASELVTLRTRVWKYQPDIILLAFLTGNDVRNNLYALEKDRSRPYFSYDPEQKILTPTKLPGSDKLQYLREFKDALYPAMKRSRVLQLISHAVDIYRQKQFVVQQPQVTASIAENQGQKVDLDNMVYLKPTDALWKEAWNVTEAIIREMNREVAKRGAVLFIATLSNGIQVHPNRSVYVEFSNRNRVQDIFYPDKRIIALAKKERIPAVMLAPELRRYAEENNVCVHGFPNALPCDGHWNTHGHRVAGERIATEICRQIMHEVQTD